MMFVASPKKQANATTMSLNILTTPMNDAAKHFIMVVAVVMQIASKLKTSVSRPAVVTKVEITEVSLS
jgi:hypothetical protein